MRRTDVSMLSNVAIAASTTVGVAAAIAYYLRDVKTYAPFVIAGVLIFYIGGMLWLLIAIRKRI
jgi:hypothetical protein